MADVTVGRSVTVKVAWLDDLWAEKLGLPKADELAGAMV